MISCGIWRSGKRLVAVVLDDADRARKPITLPRTDAAANALVAHLTEDLGAEIVLVDTLLAEPIGRAAAEGRRLWIAPRVLVEPIRQAAALSPRATAAMLARLPRIASLRTQLRRHTLDARQLTLL